MNDKKKLTQILYHDYKKLDLSSWDKIKRRWAKIIGFMPKNSDIYQSYQELLHTKKIIINHDLENSLKVRRVRTMSGVAPFAVMMGPYKCPGNCIYCIQEPGMPKSYMSDEPAAARARNLNFDPYMQVRSRLEQFEITGHNPQKLQIIIIGGTFSAYPKTYASAFIKSIYDACNGEISASIEESIVKNETAYYRIVGMSIETRPDWLGTSEIKFLRLHGVTKVQLGVQSLEKKVLEIIKRGHDLKAVAKATKLLRNSGFKINYHMMPNLPGASTQSDINGMKLLFENEDYKPDTLKIYPTIVLPNTELYQWYQEGRYKPYHDDELIKTLALMKQYVPQYCRIDRLVRDITAKWTMAGTKKTNMRDVVAKYMQENGLNCQCIRCREIKGNKESEEIKLKTFQYKANDGDEYFISFESKQYLYAMLRLRLIKKEDQLVKLFPILENAALIRELQSFGKQIKIKTKANDSAQHRSFGKRLIAEAEKISKENGFAKIAIISGVGVRQYYQKLGYKLIDTYMVKNI